MSEKMKWVKGSDLSGSMNGEADLPDLRPTPGGTDLEAAKALAAKALAEMETVVVDSTEIIILADDRR